VNDIGGRNLSSNSSHPVDERIALIAVPRDIRGDPLEREGNSGQPAARNPL